MAFTQDQLDNIATAALDFHMDKGTVHKQTIQDKPLLSRILAKKRNFPGGKDNITLRAKGAYTTTIQGFTHDDTVTYANPGSMMTATFPWKEIHSGITVTLTELKKDGISVVDSTDGRNTSQHDGREATALANLLEDKLEDMSEGTNRGMNLMFWRDGTQDAKEVPGIKSFVVDNPTATATVAGIPQGTNTWWRNRATLGISATVGGAAAQTLTLKLIQEFRQLRRYGGRPDTALCGSDFLDVLEAEMRVKGVYTQDGWAKSGKIDIGMADAMLKGVTFEYDPTLDDESESKRCYVLDFKTIRPMVMTGEDNKTHAPARPETKYVIYRAMTWTGGLVCKQRNANGVYSIA